MAFYRKSERTFHLTAMTCSSSHCLCSLLLALLQLSVCLSRAQECLSPPTVDYTVAKAVCEQPLFFTILPKTEENVLLDNVCATAFPQPDDPNLFTFLISYVYCDGSNYVQSFVNVQNAKGQFIAANPFTTQQFYLIGYAGCDTYVGYVCPLTGVQFPPYVYGISSNCSPVGLSCLRKVEEVISNACIPEQDLYVLPMKLPNRCITQKACTIPPNPFYNKLGPTIGVI